MELTIHTGTADDRNKINIEWFDHNGVKQKTVVEINMQYQDRPRTLEILVNGVCVVTVLPS